MGGACMFSQNPTGKLSSSMAVASGESSYDTIEFDEYGFLIPREDQDNLESRSHQYSAQPTSATTESWSAVCNSWTQYEKDSPHKLRQLLKKGLPRQLRSQVWQLFLNSNALKAQSTFDYQTHLSDLQSKLQSLDLSSHSNDVNMRKLNILVEHLVRRDKVTMATEVENVKGEASTLISRDLSDPELTSWARTTRQIMMDIMRTFPGHQLFMEECSVTRRSLLHIMMLYSTRYNKTVGYCQGMAYVGALLLMNMSEEDAFWALVSLFERSKYLAGFYDSSLSKMKTHADVFGLLLKEKLPKLGLHLEGLGIHPLIYVTPWFMCLFTTLPCWDTVLSICDLLFLEGINTIFRAALAIMEVCSPELLAMDQIGDVIPFLQNIPSRLVSLKNFSRVLWKTKVHRWEVEFYQDMVLEGTMATRNDRGEDVNDDERPGEQRTGHYLKRRTNWEADDDDGENEVDGRPSAKRRKQDCVRVTATPTSSAPPTSQSLFSRLVSAITPAHLSRSRHLAKTKGSTPQLSTNNCYTPRQSSTSNDENTCTCAYMNGNSDSITSGSKFKTPSASRAKRHNGGKMSAVRVKLSDVPGSSDKDIEMKDFSSSLRKRNARLSTTCSFSTENHSERVRSRLGSDSRIPSFKLDSQSPVSNNYMLMETSSDGCGLHLYPPHVHTPGNRGDCCGGTCTCTPTNQGTSEVSAITPTPQLVGRRRSVRIAKRRSMNHRVQGQSPASPFLKEGTFPTASLLSPHLDRPLQDYVQSTNHPWDHHAFKSFSTPMPLRIVQVNEQTLNKDRNVTSPFAESVSPVICGALPVSSPWQQTLTAAMDPVSLTQSPEVELKPLNVKL